MNGLPHDLVRLRAGAVPDHAPAWAAGAPGAGWAVVRRAAAPPGQLALGLRGPRREQRWAFTAAAGSVVERLRPEDLAGRPVRRDAVPALAAFARLRERLRTLPLRWGPAGSVGFELATGIAAAGPRSDLDVVVRLPQPPSADLVQALVVACAGPCRVDCLLETPLGAVHLDDLAAGGPFLLRTASGPQATTAPWPP